MDLLSLCKYCLNKQGSREDYPFGDDVLVIKVASKMFALIPQDEHQLTISLKCDPFIAESLREQHASITPGYHLNKSHWNTILIDGSIPEQELFKMIDHSYELVFKGLKKTEKDAIVQQ
ncbi:MmcQ/YjbR family DNA-binding protein [Paenibacillus agricola]|uniref:MmcQ/YjbR family DNA-binding protein n=1 Tax=Paenibacillus agricola TaxID=2716264 RepID=A0ABX0J743_9BACL|nr:MmcQ/YjbR family DNA-binding protein [Paenibacillus agricola]NHN29610.1 MmcQ/YjbR family DNA-binding protein [Paenibacillus agricola]